MDIVTDAGSINFTCQFDNTTDREAAVNTLKLLALRTSSLHLG